MSGTTYTLAAMADVVLLIGGWLFLRHVERRRVAHNASGAALVSALVLVPFMFAGIVYLILFLAVVGPSCPNGRWAC